MINNQLIATEMPSDTPLLWLLRDELSLTGTKYGCGKGQCGACTVHIDGKPARACSLPISAIGISKVTTVEANESKEMKALKEQWQTLNIPQCGYCQVGQLMSASALLTENKSPDDEAINQAMAGNICRCGTYTRIRLGIKNAAKYIISLDK